MPRSKKAKSSDAPFLKTAAEAIGTALGKLAVRTGVASPAPAEPRKSKIAAKKKASLKKSAPAARSKKPAKKSAR